MKKELKDNIFKEFMNFIEYLIIMFFSTLFFNFFINHNIALNKSLYVFYFVVYVLVHKKNKYKDLNDNKINIEINKVE